MKINIGDYEIDIKARNKKTNKKTSPADIKVFLSEILSALYDAARANENQGFNSVAKRYSEWSNAIFDALNALDYFGSDKL